MQHEAMLKNNARKIRDRNFFFKSSFSSFSLHFGFENLLLVA